MGLSVVNVRGYSIVTIFEENNNISGFVVSRRDYIDGEKKTYGPLKFFSYFSEAANYVATERYPLNKEMALKFALFLTDDIYAEGEF